MVISGTPENRLRDCLGSGDAGRPEAQIPDEADLTMRQLQSERSRYPLRVSASLVLALAVAALTVIATPRTAHACSCLHTPLPEYADEVDLAIAGRQVYMVDHSWVPFRSGITLVLKVDRVYKGRAGSVVEVRSGYPGDGDCGTEFGGMGTTGVAAGYDEHDAMGG